MYYYRIADLTLAVDGDWPQLGIGRMKEYRIGQTSDESLPDVHYHIRQECMEIDMPDMADCVEVNKRLWMHTKDGGYAMVDRVPEFSEKIINCIRANSDWSEVCGELCREDFCGVDKNMRAFQVVGETFPYVLMQHNGMVLHSSCILYQGQAVLFSAPSGTGKSTHTRLWKQYYPETVIFNDDLPAIRMKKDKSGQVTPIAYGTPWCGKTQTNENISAPIRAIVFLKQAAQNEIRRVNGAEAAFLLMQGIRKHVLPDMMQKSLDNASELVSLVPTYELSCNISREAVETVKNILF